MDIAIFLLYFLGGLFVTFIVVGVAGTIANWREAEYDERVSAIDRERGLSRPLVARH